MSRDPVVTLRRVLACGIPLLQRASIAAIGLPNGTVRLQKGSQMTAALTACRSPNRDGRKYLEKTRYCTIGPTRDSSEAVKR